jgi:antitoxin component YwqK of YwqJK toxin-antitoxin module
MNTNNKETYHINGNIRLKQKYNEKGLRDGPWLHYDINGVLESETLYSNGVLVKIVEYYPDGINKSYEANYKSGIIHGPWLGYYENGDKFIEMEYNNGKLSGFKKVYGPSGELCNISYCI